MITWYNENKKSYGLHDDNTNLLRFIRDSIVYEEDGPFQTSSNIIISKH
jgi:hypothetical protein